MAKQLWKPNCSMPRRSTKSTRPSSPSPEPRRIAESNPQRMSTRFFIAGRNESGRPLGDCLCERLSLSRWEVRRLLREQQVRISGAPCTDPQRRLQRGQRVQVRLPAAPQKKDKPTPHHRSPASPYRGPQPIIRFADEHIVVVEKPAGLTTMRHAEDVAEFGQRAKRFLPPTLADLLPDLLANAGTCRRRAPNGRAARNARAPCIGSTRTRAVWWCSPGRSRPSATSVSSSALDTIERQYLAVVRGQATPGRIESRLVRDRGDGRRGSSTSSEGQLAVTNVQIVEASASTRSSNVDWKRDGRIRCAFISARPARHFAANASTTGRCTANRCPMAAASPALPCTRRYWAFNIPPPANAGAGISRLPRDMADLVKRLRRANKA